ncbi:MAG: mechanosensitive ion channel [Thiohalocapsa sp. PB-PSB1]|nr:MAG: mechanosensitive ion channel [Thiohalocapsa sp. PB-PSB1]
MTNSFCRGLLAICLWLLAFASQIAVAQTAPVNAAPVPNAEILEAKIAEAESAADPSDEHKNQLLSLYQQALSYLQETAANEAAAQAFREALQTAPGEALAIREKTAASSAAEAEITLPLDRSSSLQDLETFLLQDKGDLALANNLLADLSRRLEEEAARPALIRQRLQSVEEELTENQAQQQLLSAAEDESMDTQARRWLLEAQAQALRTENEMLDQELSSHSARVDLLEAKREAAGQRSAAIGRRIALLEELIRTRRQADAERAMLAAETRRLEAEGQHPLVVRLAGGNASLSNQIAQTVAQLDDIARRKEATELLERQLDGDFNSAREIIAIGGSNLSGELGNLLRQQRQNLPELRLFERKAREREALASQTGIKRVLHRREQQRLMDTEAHVSRLLAEAGVDEASESMRTRLVELVDERRALLQQAIESEDLLLLELGELEASQTDLLKTIKRFDELLDVNLLWVRSASRNELAELGALPEQIWRIISPSGWYGAASVLAHQATHSAVFILLGSALIAFLWGRKYLVRFVEETSNKLGKPITDRFAYTLQVLIVSLVAAAAWPLLAAVVGWQLQVSEAATEFSAAVGIALVLLAMQFYLLRAFRFICIPRGLAAAHFRWPEPSLQLLRRELDRLSWTYLPAAGVTAVIVALDPLNAGWAVGRIALVILVVSLAIALYRLFHPRSGVLAFMPSHGSERRLPFLHAIWYPLCISAPLAFGMLAVLGFIYTAATLIGRYVNSIWLIVILTLLAALAQRWVRVTRRRIAYQKAMERRQALRAAREQAAVQDGADDLSGLIEVDEPEVDLESLSDTSDDLIKTGVIVAGLIGVWIIWSDVIPALRILDNITLWRHIVTVDGEDRIDPVTLADLGLTLVFAVATFVLAKQLPAVLEMLLLRRADISAGGRYTIITLTTYAIITFGLLLVFGTIGVQWSQLQWLVAALGVGIGFGLQEIVANFISGLIILFERPIRVGDIVTVGDTDGVVTRIQIRATTIRNWDRKELLVPNKEFVTGRLLNWSLSDKMTRVVVVAGVAYGSDVDRALSLMREAAQEHEYVLDDPAPILSFEGFGDNSLTLILRAYLSSIEYRIATITDLHKAINRKFAEAGIVIAFPQRDLHLDMKGPLQVQLQHAVDPGNSAMPKSER